MKAVILAAGKGTRLSQITETLPKPLIQVRGKPLLEHCVELCKKHGVTEIFVNTHHLAEKITSSLGNGKRFGLTITYSFEPEPLGTAGALNNFKAALDEDGFFVLYGDNFSDFDLSSLKHTNEFHGAIATIGFHHRNDVTSSGVAEFDQSGRILKFIEKPKPGETKSHWVNAGVYYLTSAIHKYIPTEGYCDFAMDVFPRLLQEGIPIFGVCSNLDVSAFDDPSMYEQSLRKLQ